MGCWQETCALTHLPIYENDECVMVLMDESFTKLLEQYPEIGRFDTDQSFSHIESIHHGKYNDYGWIKKLNNPELPDENGVTRHLSQLRVTIFFHKRVWEEAVKAGMERAKQWEGWRLTEIESRKEYFAKSGREEFEDPFAPKPYKKEMVEFRAVHEVAYWSRRNLMISHYFHGAQCWKDEHYDLVHKLTNEIWADIKKKFEEE